MTEERCCCGRHCTASVAPTAAQYDQMAGIGTSAPAKCRSRDGAGTWFVGQDPLVFEMGKRWDEVHDRGFSWCWSDEM